MKEFTGDFYDEDYYQRGKQSGKGWLENYRWMPRRTLREAFAFIDLFGLDENCSVLDFGCSYGFLVKALRILEIPACGCDISTHALQYAPEGCWNCADDLEFDKHTYSHIVCKDVLEHLTPDQLQRTLVKLAKMSSKFAVVVPIGDNGIYRIKEYHLEVSHLIAEDDGWWKESFSKAGWTVKNSYDHVKGIKDNWVDVHQKGNKVFVLEHT